MLPWLIFMHTTFVRQWASTTQTVCVFAPASFRGNTSCRGHLSDCRLPIQLQTGFILCTSRAAAERSVWGEAAVHPWLAMQDCVDPPRWPSQSLRVQVRTFDQIWPWISIKHSVDEWKLFAYPVNVGEFRNYIHCLAAHSWINGRFQPISSH